MTMSIISRLRLEFIQDLDFAITWMPGSIGFRLRKIYFKRLMKNLGPRAVLGPGMVVNGAENIYIGDRFACLRNCTLMAFDNGLIEFGNRVSFNNNVYINACVRGKIILGNDVSVGPNVVMRASDHVMKDVNRPINQQGHTGGDIIIEDDIWIGANVTTVGGIRIGKGAVVAAGAVVTRDVEPYTVVGGVPAVFIKRRGD